MPGAWIYSPAPAISGPVDGMPARCPCTGITGPVPIQTFRTPSGIHGLQGDSELLGHGNLADPGAAMWPRVSKWVYAELVYFTSRSTRARDQIPNRG